jgi:hypothetical protein
MPSSAWIVTAVAGKVWSGVEVASKIDGVRADTSVREGFLRCREPKMGRHLTVSRHMPLTDARTLHDPLVGRVDLLGELGVGKNARRQIAAYAADDGTDIFHDAARSSMRVGSACSERPIAFSIREMS